MYWILVPLDGKRHGNPTLCSNGISKRFMSLRRTWAADSGWELNPQKNTYFACREVMSPASFAMADFFSCCRVGVGVCVCIYVCLSLCVCARVLVCLCVCVFVLCVCVLNCLFSREWVTPTSNLRIYEVNRLEVYTSLCVCVYIYLYIYYM